MNINIGLPNITSTTPQGQMGEMRSYIYQLAEQLNWAFNTISEAQSSGNTSQIAIDKGNGVKESISPEEAQSTFNSIKALIIKSADIVKAYEETIITDFNSEYFADSDFGTYLETTNRTVTETAGSVTDIINNVQTIKDEVMETNGYIRRGILEDGIIGVEIGETNDNGVFIKCARFVKDRLSFYDEGKYEVAYIGKGCLYINGDAVFLGNVTIKGYVLDTSNGIAFNWTGGDT